jgi:hypothetical protein
MTGQLLISERFCSGALRPRSVISNERALYMSRAGKIIHEDAEGMQATIPGVFSQLAGSNILITGASGFLGSYIVDILSVLNHPSPSLNANIVASDNFIATNADRLAHLKGDPFIEFRTANVVDETVGAEIHWMFTALLAALLPTARDDRPMSTAVAYTDLPNARREGHALFLVE